MKLTSKSLLLLIIIFIAACSDTNQSKITDESRARNVNCYETVGDIPDLTILNSEYYGKVFIGVTFDTTNNVFENYNILRSTLYKKSDLSVFSTYDSDNPKSPAPEVYNQIVKEIKRRIDNSGVAMNRRKDIEKCMEINWVILPIVLK